MNKNKIIAKAIKKADNTYFFENYSKQANSVIRSLDEAGFKIVPKKPTKEMIKSGIWAISLGMVDAKELAKSVYEEMLDNYDE